MEPHTTNVTKAEERKARNEAARKITPVKVAITETSLKDAIYASDKRYPSKDGSLGYGHTKMDIAELVAGHKAADFNEWMRVQSTTYMSRASFVRRWISLGDVQKHIDSLVEKGWLVAVKGNDSLMHGYGTQRNATYYMRAEVYRQKIKRREEKRGETKRQQAEAKATEILIAAHKAEHEAIVEAILAGK